MILKSTPLGQLGTNCYLFGDEDQKLCALVDPGDEPARVAELVKESGCELIAIFVTHGHYDHCLAVPAIAKAFPKAKVYIHEAELNAESIPNNYMQMTPVENLQLVGEGDVVSVGTLKVEIMNTPGHSPGSLVLRVADCLFAGDTLFAGSCGRTDFYGGSYPQMLASLKRLHDLPGDFKVYPGHEASSTLERERQQNSYMREALRAVK